MRFNSLVKLTCLLGLAGYANASGYRMSFYGTNGNGPSDIHVPACGKNSHYNTKYFVALNAEQYIDSQSGSGSNSASVCDKCVKIVYENKWAVGRIVDKCPGCPYKGLDVSLDLFTKFASESKGIVYMNWSYTDCSQLGESGTCDGECSVSGSSHESPVKATTTKKTTTTTKKTTTTTIVKPTNAVINTTAVSQVSAATTTVAPVETLGVAPPNMDGVIISASSNTTVINNGTVIQNNGTFTPTNSTIANAPVQVPINQIEKNEKAKTNQVEPSKVKSEEKEEDEGTSATTYVIPITGALVVSGAAGIALVYAKRESTDLNSLKQKFPEAFSNIKRSISRGSTSIRRSLSTSGKALKRSLSKKNVNGGNSGLHIRTKKEYRESLDAHYPIQLYDPPVPSAVGASTSKTQNTYQLQQFDTQDDNSNLQVDFHDNYF